MAKEVKTRPCGAVHAKGVCFKPIYYTDSCCEFSQQTYTHNGYHEAKDDRGHIVARWEEVRVIKDAPFDAYLPMEDHDGV